MNKEIYGTAIVVALAVGGYFLFSKNSSALSFLPSSTGGNSWGLPDIDSSLQGGIFATTYDESFEKASNQTGVPFALIKAHAIRESSLNPNAYHYDNQGSGASYGLLQVEWNTQGRNFDRFAPWGFTGAQIGDGSLLYDPDTNAFLGAKIIEDNLRRFGGNLRDAINAYNTGVAESVREAPANYVNDVLGYYSTLVGSQVS